MKITKVRDFLLSGSIGIMVISGGVALGETSDISTNSASSQLRGQIFQVEGRNRNGNTFTTCYRFRENNTLSVDNLMGIFRYEPSRSRNFQAVRRTRFFSNGRFVTLAGIGMNGSVSATGRRISGQGIRQNGSTFTFRGRRNPNCQIGSLSTLQEIPPENEPLDPAPVENEPNPPF